MRLLRLAGDTSANEADVLAAHAVPASDLGLAHATCECRLDSPHRLVAHGGHSMPLAARLATFGNLIRDVVGLAAEKQVVGIHARFVVAAVKDELPHRDWTDKEDVCPAVGQAASRGSLALGLELPVAGREKRTVPDPATVRALIDAVKETLDDCRPVPLGRESLGVVSGAVVLEAQAPSLDGLVASSQRTDFSAHARHYNTLRGVS